VSLDDLLRIVEAADDDGREWEWEGGYPQRITRGSTWRETPPGFRCLP
jgi:hypothetical protein